LTYVEVILRGDLQNICLAPFDGRRADVLRERSSLMRPNAGGTDVRRLQQIEFANRARRRRSAAPDNCGSPGRPPGNSGVVIAVARQTLELHVGAFV
jgi:hypothetical protein